MKFLYHTPLPLSSLSSDSRFATCDCNNSIAIFSSFLHEWLSTFISHALFWLLQSDPESYFIYSIRELISLIFH